MWYYTFPETESMKDFDFYIRIVGKHDLQPPMVKPNGHPRDQFFYATNGTGTLILNETEYFIQEGMGFFIPAKMPHEYYPHNNIWDIRWFVPEGTGLNKLYRQLGITPGAYHLNNTSTLDTIINNIHYDLLSDEQNGCIIAAGNTMKFIIEFAKQGGLIKTTLKKEDTLSAYTKHFNKITDYISYNYMNKITMQDLERITNLSSQHICRITHNMVGMRPMEYISYIRINQAKELIENTSHPLSSISYYCGFENENYFWKTFKKFTGTTPGSFRQK